MNYKERFDYFVKDYFENSVSKTLKEVLKSLIIVFGDTNDLLYLKNWNVEFTYKCTTGKNWFGNEKWSKATPLWLHKICGLYGDKTSIVSIFKWRQKVDELQYFPEYGKVYPVIMTRILQLQGLEERNSNTYSRYIYIHWTPNIWYWKAGNLKKTYGCISLLPLQMLELFNLVKKETETYVYILN